MKGKRRFNAKAFFRRHQDFFISIVALSALMLIIGGFFSLQIGFSFLYFPSLVFWNVVSWGIVLFIISKTRYEKHLFKVTSIIAIVYFISALIPIGPPQVIDNGRNTVYPTLFDLILIVVSAPGTGLVNLVCNITNSFQSTLCKSNPDIIYSLKGFFKVIL